ncbi:hypothetical protein BKA65DRAFT_571959 [Rhexocercosporidium sp. MPI-PUGE-AT-0058]|nr:hypothetical protein BKA65DRAFT_571959 [Rhexocercosporidium sp. MPI-PUGE-AT-0058]
MEIQELRCSAPRNIRESLGIELVNIYVGKDPNRKQFVIHKKLICDKVDFFHKAFISGFKENEGTMDLPDETPEVFGMFVAWLYRSDSEVGKFTTKEQYIGIFNLYFFAEKLCIEDLQNRLIDHIRLTASPLEEDGDAACVPWITIGFAAVIFKNTSAESPLRSYCVHELAWRLWGFRDSTMPASSNISTIFALWSQQDDLVKSFFDFLRASPNDIDSLWDDMMDGELTECMFHRHGVGEVCYLKAKGQLGGPFANGNSWSESMKFED